MAYQFVLTQYFFYTLCDLYMRYVTYYNSYERMDRLGKMVANVK